MTEAEDDKPQTEKPKRVRKPKPKNRRSPPIEETEEDAKQRRVFHEIVDVGRMDDQFYVRDPTPEERGIVRSMVFAGLPQEKISACLGLDLHRLQYLFRKELDHGRELMVAEIAYTLAARARAGSDAAAIYLLKVRGGPAFSEARATREAENLGEGGADPVKIEQSEKDKLVNKIMSLIQKVETDKVEAGAETK